VLAGTGCVICAAGPGLAPADRRLYRLRDVTATVDSIPLIASSIMSKKIAEGTSALVLDVKVGSGAFMREVGDARRLAETMVELGTEHGVRTTALLTRMDEPLGNAVGNGLEVAESLETLRARGPADLVELTLALAREMLGLAGVCGPSASIDPADALADGRALECFRAMVTAQGGDPDSPLRRSEHVETVTAPESGYLRRLDALSIGVAAWRLGAGRARKEDEVSPTAGVVCLAKRGDPVEAGAPLLELHADDAARFVRARDALAGAIEIASEPPPRVPLVIETIRA
jgi:thymidine phosphorylase